MTTIRIDPIEMESQLSAMIEIQVEYKTKDNRLAKYHVGMLEGVINMLGQIISDLNFSDDSVADLIIAKSI